MTAKNRLFLAAIILITPHVGIGVAIPACVLLLVAALFAEDV